MRNIPIGHGMFATVDDEDFQAMSTYTWHRQKGVNTFYAATNVRKGNRYVTVGMHRMINETPDGLHTDHRDGNGLNNTRANLRTATRTENQRNRQPNRKGTSTYKGVYWDRQKSMWRASIRVNGQLKHIGLFTDQRVAAQAYAERAALEFGEFANTGATQ